MHGPAPHSPFNGHTFEIAKALGELGAESRRHTEILLGLQDRLLQLPERIAAAMPEAPAPTPAPTPRPGLVARLGSLRDWVVLAVAVAGLTAAIVGRLPWADLSALLERLPK